MTFSRTSLANRALDLVGKPEVLDIDSSTTETGKLVQRNYEPVFLRCLRKAEPLFAIKRVALSASVTAPLNQYSTAYPLPADNVKVLRVFGCSDYKIETDQILANSATLEIKYVSNATLAAPAKLDPAFAEWFAYELAVAIAYKVSSSVTLRNELRQEAEQRFREAAALSSQEDIDDPIPTSDWISVRGSSDSDGFSGWEIL